MKKRFSIFVLALVLATLGITTANETKAMAFTKGFYVSTQYLRWDADYTADRSGIGHYIVILDSGYLNVRDQPSSNSNIIAKLFNGYKVTTDDGLGINGWSYVIYPLFR